jgi:hypothetical protein
MTERERRTEDDAPIWRSNEDTVPSLRREDRSEPVSDPSVAEADDEKRRVRGDDAVTGLQATGTGGNPPGAVTTEPGADLPDPLGTEDDERELERRTR